MQANKLSVRAYRTNAEHTPYDGRPYYCSECGLGYGEFMACELADCTLETEGVAVRRQRREQQRRNTARKAKAAARGRLVQGQEPQ